MDIAILIPVGPDDKNLDRLADLLASIRCFEPDIRDIVVIDDGPSERRMPRFAHFRVTCLPNPRQSKGIGNLGGLWTGLVFGWKWIETFLPGTCALKLDLDALVIGPFARSLAMAFAQNPGAGLIGCVGETSNRAEPLFQACMRRESGLRIVADAISQIESPPDDVSEVKITFRGHIRTGTREQFLSFKKVMPHIERAIANGLQSEEYCQGGAYAISPELLRRMRAEGFLDDCALWMPLPFGEDLIAGMYCKAVQLAILDFSDRRQIFGIRYEGLPAPPEELVGHGHSIIHSLKDQAGWTEENLRQFFSAIRSAGVSSAALTVPT